MKALGKTQAYSHVTYSLDVQDGENKNKTMNVSITKQEQNSHVAHTVWMRG